ncbi:MAG: alginate export family protein [Phycisphaerae bacterium]|nr:alginate export family protein [Phycisphaerae bacterium]
MADNARTHRRYAGFAPLVALAILSVVAPARDATAQSRQAYLNRQRAIEEEVRDQLDRDLPADQKVNIDWGGWYNSWIFLYDDGIESSRTERRNDFRLWAGMTLDEGAHELYARGRLSFIDWNHGDSYDRDEDDIEGPYLERGYYKFDLRKAIKAYQNRNIDENFTFKIGRDLVEFGTGYALSLPLEHILLTAEVAKFEVTGLIGRSIGHIDDIENSRPNGSMDRNFFGVQARYLGWEKHEPFVYVLWNDDQAGETPPIPFQNFTYDSFYVGLGSRGELLKNLRYTTEWVFEHGDSYGHLRSRTKDDINAWAFDVALEYLTQWPLKPRFVGEYMFASGDPDRIGSPTNSLYGNMRGDDTSFVGFGYRDTGLSFAPTLSNVHVWRAGASIVPFERIEWLDKLELGTDWFLYHKNRRRGAVSDPTADEQSGFLGWEMDYFANWRLTSDLALTTRYGIFFPGEAFSDRTTRTFFMSGVTWSF